MAAVHRNVVECNPREVLVFPEMSIMGKALKTELLLIIDEKGVSYCRELPIATSRDAELQLLGVDVLKEGIYQNDRNRKA